MPCRYCDDEGLTSGLIEVTVLQAWDEAEEAGQVPLGQADGGGDL